MEEGTSFYMRIACEKASPRKSETETPHMSTHVRRFHLPVDAQ
jgi:hypothetical protein